MNYNDFPILNDDNYRMIQSEYEKFLPFNRKSQIDKLYFTLEECRHLCFGLDKKYNKLISTAILKTKTEIEKIMDNLHATFNLNIEYRKEINEFNLFTFIKKIINSISEFKEWYTKEEKEYYKKISSNSMSSLLSCLNDLITSLENSNLHIFKYM